MLCLLVTLTWTAPVCAQSDPAEYNNLGITAYNAGRYREAVTYFEKAYDGARDNQTVHRNLCNAHQAMANDFAKKNDFTDATSHLMKAIGVDPENPSPLVQLGSYYLRMDRISDAIFRLEEAIELKPGELEAHELLGEAYYRDNDLPSARVQWDYVLAMDPKRTELKERYEKAFREESVESDFNRAGSRHFKISYPKGMEYSTRARILNVLEGAYWDIGKKLGGTYPPPPIQVIIYDADQFSEATKMDANVGALYDGKIRAPMTDASGQALPEEEMKRRLIHEYVHVVVRNQLAEKAPWWLNEGLAEALSHSVEQSEQNLLSKAYAENVAFHLGDLEAHQLKALSAEPLRLAYAQAHATVSLLLTRFGQPKMAQFLSVLTSGQTAEAALGKVYHHTYAKLEAEVKASHQ